MSKRIRYNIWGAGVRIGKIINHQNICGSKKVHGPVHDGALTFFEWFLRGGYRIYNSPVRIGLMYRSELLGLGWNLFRIFFSIVYQKQLYLNNFEPQKDENYIIKELSMN